MRDLLLRPVDGVWLWWSMVPAAFDRIIFLGLKSERLVHREQRIYHLWSYRKIWSSIYYVYTVRSPRLWCDWTSHPEWSEIVCISSARNLILRSVYFGTFWPCHRERHADPPSNPIVTILFFVVPKDTKCSEMHAKTILRGFYIFCFKKISF